MVSGMTRRNRAGPQSKDSWFYLGPARRLDRVKSKPPSRRRRRSQTDFDLHADIFRETPPVKAPSVCAGARRAMGQGLEGAGQQRA